MFVMGNVTELDSVGSSCRGPGAGVYCWSRPAFYDSTRPSICLSGPNIQGTWNLHTALAKQPLDLLELFSSFAGPIGQRSQAKYASTSTFFDAPVQFRHGLGLPASVLDVGLQLNGQTSFNSQDDIALFLT
ncbi:KR domain-containing protein [Nemania serpens]|nr:KR domain-containing protein [Nemania serpens]